MAEKADTGIPVPEGEIQVKKVTFHYDKISQEEEREDILKDFSTCFEADNINGIPGKSGCP